MGIILSIFRRSKPSTRDTLEKIEQELQNIEERRWDRLKREKLIVQLLSFLSVTFVIVTLFVSVFPRSGPLQDKLWLALPMTMLSFGSWQCKKLIQWYSNWSRENEEARMRKLRKEKKKILENVCETESYKVASELLDRYDPKHLRRRNVPDQQLHPTLLEHSMSSQLNNMNTSINKFSASPIRTNNRMSLPPQISSSQLKQDLMKTLLNQSINLIQTSNANTSIMQQDQQQKPSQISKVTQSISTKSDSKLSKSKAKESIKERSESSESSDNLATTKSVAISSKQDSTEANTTTLASSFVTPAKTTIATGSSKTYVTSSSNNNNNNNILNNSLAALPTKSSNQIIAASSVQGRPVRPILSRERSLFEKMIDWVVTDGPDNRFALICRSCYGHNGMCLEDEYSRLSFRCCYCYNLNMAEARQTLEPNTTIAATSTSNT